jgi:uncharacterized protein YqgC (DUF456 family)
MSHVIVIVVVGLLMVAGLVGAIIPALPSTPLILIGALIYGFFTDFQQVTPWVLVTLGVLTLLSLLLDYLAGIYGAKKMNASRWGMTGAFLGTVVGLFGGGLVGVIVGPLIGAFVFELLFARKRFTEAMRVGFGALLGFLGGALGKLLIGLVMCGIFLWNVLG